MNNKVMISPKELHTRVVKSMSDYFDHGRKQLSELEKLNFLNFFNSSFLRYKGMTLYLTKNWLVAFKDFTKKVKGAISQSKNEADIAHFVKFWFNSFCELIDEFLLIKFGAVTCEYDRNEHEDYILVRNKGTKEKFPKQDSFDEFTSCSFYGFRDLLKAFRKMSQKLEGRAEDFIIVAGGEVECESKKEEFCLEMRNILNLVEETINKNPLVKKMDFSAYSDSFFVDRSLVTFSLEFISGTLVEQSKSQIPVRVRRTIAYVLQSCNKKPMGTTNISQDVEPVPCTDSPMRVKAVEKVIRLNFMKNPNMDEINPVRDEQAMTLFRNEAESASEESSSESESEAEAEVKVAKGNAEEEEVATQVDALDMNDENDELDTACVQNHNSPKSPKSNSAKGTIKSPSASMTVTMEQLSVGGQNSAMLITPTTRHGVISNANIPVRNYSPSDFDDSDEDLVTLPVAKTGKKGRLVHNTNKMVVNDDDMEDNNLLEVIAISGGAQMEEEENYDDEDVLMSDSEEQEIEDQLKMNHQVFSSKQIRKVSEIEIFRNHVNITDNEVRKEVFHGVMAKILTDGRLISAIAGFTVQNYETKVDWLSEMALIKEQVKLKMGFVPPVTRAKDNSSSSSSSSSKEIVTTQTDEEKRTNNKLNKQANRSIFEVLKIIINTAALLKANPTIAPKVIPAEQLMLMSDSEQSVHYMQVSLINYPEEDLFLLEEELRRVGPNGSNLSISMTSAKAKQASAKKTSTYSGNFSKMDSAGSLSATKKRKRVTTTTSEAIEEAKKQANLEAEKILLSAKRIAESLRIKQAGELQKKERDLQEASDTIKKKEKDLQEKNAQYEKSMKESTDKVKQMQEALEAQLAAAATTSSTLSTVQTSAVTAVTAVATVATVEEKIVEEEGKVRKLQELIEEGNKLRQTLAAMNEKPTSFPSITTKFFGSSSSQNMPKILNPYVSNTSSSVIASVASDRPSVMETLKDIALGVGDLTDLDFSWFLDAFMLDVILEESSTLDLIKRVIDTVEWKQCVLEATDILIENSVLIECTETSDYVRNPQMPFGSLKGANVLALFAYSNLEYLLIKNILFKLLHEFTGGEILNNKNLTYCGGKFGFEMKKRGAKFDQRLLGDPFSFFQTQEYFQNLTSKNTSPSFDLNSPNPNYNMNATNGESV